MTTADTVGPTGPNVPLDEGVLLRQRRMETFSLSEPKALEDALSSIGDVPPHVFLKKPASGLVMVRGRVSGSGQLVNIGEMLVSRCVVELDGVAGYGFTPFESLRHCELAAVLDALAAHPVYRKIVDGLEGGLRARLEEKAKGEALEAEATKVEFFTVKLGEDE